MELKEILKIIEEIQYIKSFGDPPFLKDDMFYNRKPWNKFGGVSSGICQCWCWYCDEYIYSNTTAEDRQMAKEEMEKFYKND
jgi:hypothetical protein